MSQIKVELQDWMGSDRAIAEAAWTSSSDLQQKELKTDADVERIITTVLTKPIIEVSDTLSQHATPFESVILRFWIKMPIAIDRQHMTHRIASHNGMSGRYRTMPSEFLEVPQDVKEITKKHATNLYGKNESFEIDTYTNICTEANFRYQGMIRQFKESEKLGYITNKEFKRLREFYRGMLPQHNMTERTTIFNLRSFANYQKLRNSTNAQPEILEVAEQMYNLVKEAKICPIALACLEQNYWII